MAWNGGNGFGPPVWDSWYSGNGNGYITGEENQQNMGDDEILGSFNGNGGIYINPAFIASATSFNGHQYRQILWMYQQWQQSQAVEQMRQMGYMDMSMGMVNDIGLYDPFAMQLVGPQYPMGNALYQAPVNNAYQTLPLQTRLNPQARGWLPPPTITQVQPIKQEAKLEEHSKLVACTLDELIAQSANATSTKPKKTSPLPESTPKAPKAMLGLFQGTQTKGPAVSQPHDMSRSLKTPSKPSVSSGVASSSQSSEDQTSSTKTNDSDETVKPELRCYNCGKVDDHDTMYCTNGCGHCGKNGHQTICCPNILKGDGEDTMHKDRKAMIERAKNKINVKDGKKDAGGRNNKRDIMRGPDCVGNGNGDTKGQPESSYYRGPYGNDNGGRDQQPGENHWSLKDKKARDHGNQDAMARIDMDQKVLRHGRLRSLSPLKEIAFQRGRKDSWRGPTRR